MAYKSYFYDAKLVGGVYDRLCTAQDLADFYAILFTDGIVGGSGTLGTNLQVSAVLSSMTTTMHEGWAIIQGRPFRSYGSLPPFSHSASHATLGRIDRIVLEVNLTDEVRDAYPKLLTGTPAVTPYPPVLTQNATVYQISLAQVLIAASVTSITSGNITDERVLSVVNVVSPGAAIDSPTFTGTPAAPTAAQGTNTTQLATTEFVQRDSKYKRLTTGTTIDPDKQYDLGTYTGALSVTLNAPSDTTITHEWCFAFKTGASGYSLSLVGPGSVAVKWSGGTAPTLAANKSYQINVKYFNNGTATRVSRNAGGVFIMFYGKMMMGASPTYAIDVGSPAIVRAAGGGGTNTCIDYNNPVNKAGKLTKVQIYSGGGMTGVYIGIFYSTGAGVFSSRDYEYFASIAGSSMQELTVDLTVQVGDYIGIYSDGGYISTDTTGGGGAYYASGNHTNEANVTYTYYSGYITSIYGLGY